MSHNVDKDAHHQKKKRSFYDTFSNLETSDGEHDKAYGFSRRYLFSAKKITPKALVTSSISSTSVNQSRPTGSKQLQQKIIVPSRRPPPSAVPRTKAKRKGQNVIRLVPAEQRLFQGLQFYFIPNDDSSTARRLRIIKALEYGASWQSSWNEFVTHIVVDIEVDYSTILGHLKVDKIPATVVVVNETWPAECLAFGTLLGPDHKAAFTVRGRLAQQGITAFSAPASDMPHSSTTSDSSLVLKPAGKVVQARPPTTPDLLSDDDPAHVPGQVSTNPNPTSSEGVGDTAIKVSISPFSIPQIEVPVELQSLVREVRELAVLPLDDEDEDGSQSGSSAGAFSKAKRNWQDSFQCMQAHTSDDAAGTNAHIIQVLQAMAGWYQQTGDEWRTRAYRKAIATLRPLTHEITTKEQAAALPNVGARLAEKIMEIVVTNRLRRLDEVSTEPSDNALRLFLRIYGVGPVQASSWVSRGYRTLEDLLAKADLTFNQRIGIEHTEDFNLRIPRDEVKLHGETVERALHEIDPDFKLVIGGSYRRGQPSSGDIDCVITHPRLTLEQMRLIMLDKIIAPLTRQGFLKVELSAMARDDGSKWLGASCLPDSKVWRRMDFLLVPDDELGAAMIYFTGNDIFNRSLRLLASKKGMRLNQRGLYAGAIRGRQGVKLTDGTLLEGRDERRIFEILGVPWREPHERLI